MNISFKLKQSLKLKLLKFFLTFIWKCSADRLKNRNSERYHLCDPFSDYTSYDLSMRWMQVCIDFTCKIHMVPETLMNLSEKQSLQNKTLETWINKNGFFLLHSGYQSPVYGKPNLSLCRGAWCWWETQIVIFLLLRQACSSHNPSHQLSNYC